MDFRGQAGNFLNASGYLKELQFRIGRWNSGASFDALVAINTLALFLLFLTRYLGPEKCSLSALTYDLYQANTAVLYKLRDGAILRLHA